MWFKKPVCPYWAATWTAYSTKWHTLKQYKKNQNTAWNQSQKYQPNRLLKQDNNKMQNIFTRYPLTSAASTRPPFCKSTSATAIEPLTAAQCSAVCLTLSCWFTSPPCFKNIQMRLPKNNSSKHTNQMQLYTEHILTNYINLNKKILKKWKLYSCNTSIMYWATSGKLLREAHWRA